MSKSHPNTVVGHEGNREKVCAPCGRKIPGKSIRKINSNESECIKMYIESDFDLSNPIYPVGICSKCQKIFILYKQK